MPNWNINTFPCECSITWETHSCMPPTPLYICCSLTRQIQSGHFTNNNPFQQLLVVRSSPRWVQGCIIRMWWQTDLLKKKKKKKAWRKKTEPKSETMHMDLNVWLSSLVDSFPVFVCVFFNLSIIQSALTIYPFVVIKGQQHLIHCREGTTLQQSWLDWCVTHTQQTHTAPHTSHLTSLFIS